ncbi:MAG: hypothetical protein ABSC37_14895 [Xanthobacteraceae bacterium]
MTDYHPLIARAVEGLGKSTGEARRALYERARAALVAQLRGVEPALPESDITKERLALEEAIRKVEGEVARKARAEPRTQLRPESRFEPPPAAPPPRSSTAEAGAQAPPAPAMALRRERSSPAADELPLAGGAEARRAAPSLSRQHADEPARDEAPRPAMRPTARSRLLNARLSSLTEEGLKGFRNVVSEVDDLGAATAKAAQSARDTRDSYAPGSPQRSPQAEHVTPPPSLQDAFEPQFDADELHPADADLPQLHSLEPSHDLQDEQPVQPPRSARPHPPRTMELEEGYEEPRPPRSHRGLARIAVLLIIFVALAATVSWQWSNITGLYHFFAQTKSRQPSQTTQAPAAQPKFSGRVPQEQGPGQAPSAGTPGSQTAPAVAQRVVLYEEDPNNPQGKRFVGSAIWRTETVSPGPGLAPELAVRADIEIPERQITVTWSLRRNTDKALPASHTIEIMFNLPADFPGGGISNVPGILMKEAEQARGTPLAGLAVKVTNGYFLIGLSAVDADMQRNLQLLKERPWFDIPIVYTNGGRAILAMEKGPPGDRAFADAFAAWQK